MVGETDAGKAGQRVDLGKVSRGGDTGGKAGGDGGGTVHIKNEAIVSAEGGAEDDLGGDSGGEGDAGDGFGDGAGQA